MGDPESQINKKLKGILSFASSHRQLNKFFGNKPSNFATNSCAPGSGVNFINYFCAQCPCAQLLRQCKASQKVGCRRSAQMDRAISIHLRRAPNFNEINPWSERYLGYPAAMSMMTIIHSLQFNTVSFFATIQ